MKQKRNQTLDEIKENELVDRIYNNQILSIKKLIYASKLTIADLCVHLNIDSATLHQWYQGKRPTQINFHTYTHASSSTSI
ncbi:hypothetical protein [Bacteroides acidifaciens]|uniref:hypothetical protein n=1 Tax=Bacteroides acidifaciens TaxID=85831 RepID=UPI0020CA82E5|nr:hypothetical protein [Bacteroides acidifaciens]